jgi:hypothetical protein
MKRILFIFAFGLNSLYASAQYFEGKVVYQNNFQSKIPSISNQQLGAMMGSKQTWYIKGGDYKSEYNGTFAQWLLYLNRDNRAYSKMSNMKAILWKDMDHESDKVVSIELHKGVAVILGYKCDELIVRFKNSKHIYYFTSRLPIDSKLFVHHLAGGWYTYLSKAHAVALKQIIDIPKMTVTSVATEVKPMNLDKTLFALPANTQLMKSPY